MTNSRQLQKINEFKRIFNNAKEPSTLIRAIDNTLQKDYMLIRVPNEDEVSVFTTLQVIVSDGHTRIPVQPIETLGTSDATSAIKLAADQQLRDLDVYSYLLKDEMLELQELTKVFTYLYSLTECSEIQFINIERRIVRTADAIVDRMFDKIYASEVMNPLEEKDSILNDKINAIFDKLERGE